MSANPRRTFIIMARLVCCAIVFASMALAGCNERQPTQPFAPTPAPSAPTPPGGFSLSGVVIEDTSAGSRAVPGGRVLFWMDSRSGGHVEVDTSGRYTISGLTAGRFVRVTWIGFSAEIGGLRLHQPCPANATIAGGTELDIEVVRLGSREFTYGSPTLSGVVFETTPQGRQPLGNTGVMYSLNTCDGFDAYTQTDADGRYQFCRIPQGVGRIRAGDCNDDGFVLPVEVKGDTVVDIDLTSFNASCRSRTSAVKK